MNIPICGGLNPIELSTLIYRPFDKTSPIQLQKSLDDELVKELQFIKFCQQLLKEIQEQKSIRLTPKGNLNRKFVHQMYNHRIYEFESVDDGTIKLRSEEDFMPLTVAHFLLKGSGMIKKTNNKVFLTKKGEKTIGAEGKVYLALLKAYASKLDWSYLSYFEEEVGQTGWGYTMFLLLTYGQDYRAIKFYEEEYLQVLPDIMRRIPKGPHINRAARFSSNFQGKFFGRFCNMFSLVDYQITEDEVTKEEYSKVKKSALLDLVFRVERMR